MPVNYLEYRDSVEALFDSDDEINRRNAISRSNFHQLADQVMASS